MIPRSSHRPARSTVSRRLDENQPGAVAQSLEDDVEEHQPAEPVEGQAGCEVAVDGGDPGAGQAAPGAGQAGDPLEGAHLGQVMAGEGHASARLIGRTGRSEHQGGADQAETERQDEQVEIALAGGHRSPVRCRRRRLAHRVN